VGQVASQDLAHEFELLRTQAYAATDDSSTPRAELISLRVQILGFAVKCTVAVITASSGSAMISGNAAERRVREAMFLQVQAQTEEMRNAALSRLVAPTAFGAISTHSNP